MKSVLISIQPYWVFLIIAKAMSWDIPQEKTIEVRKDFPKDKAWNKVVHIYCSKDKESFNLIPAQYHHLMRKFIGKVIGEFLCDNIYDIKPHCDIGDYVNQYECRWKYGEDFHCLSFIEMKSYLKNKKGYGWHISKLKIYEKPKELVEFRKCDIYCGDCKHIVLPTDRLSLSDCDRRCDKFNKDLLFYDSFNRCEECLELNTITRPPQSWCYVEE